MERVTDRGSADFVEPADRIATFDNDGTLCCEFPAPAQVFFFFDRLHEAPKCHPSLAARPAYKALLSGDLSAVTSFNKREVFDAGLAGGAGTTAEQSAVAAKLWLDSAYHPELRRRFSDSVYKPQLELLALLRENSFRTFVVSSGGIDLIRAFCEQAYGIPRERVVGSSPQLRFGYRFDRGEVVKLADISGFDEHDAKSENIHLHIGRRPILAFGNSDGDLAMLRYVRSGRGARLALLLHHDDGAREFAYDREFKLGPLAEGLDRADEYGLTKVSMRDDWAAVFPGRRSDEWRAFWR